MSENPYAVAAEHFEPDSSDVDPRNVFNVEFHAEMIPDRTSEIASSVMRYWWPSRIMFIYLAIFCGGLLYIVVRVSSAHSRIVLLAVAIAIFLLMALNALSRYVFYRYYAKNYRSDRATVFHVFATDKELKLKTNDAVVLLDWRSVSVVVEARRGVFLCCSNIMSSFGIGLSPTSDDEATKLRDFARRANKAIAVLGNKYIGPEIRVERTLVDLDVSHVDQVSFQGPRRLNDILNARFSTMLRLLALISIVRFLILGFLLFCPMLLLREPFAGLVIVVVIFALMVLRRLRQLMRFYSLAFNPRAVVTMFKGFATPLGAETHANGGLTRFRWNAFENYSMTEQSLRGISKITGQPMDLFLRSHFLSTSDFEQVYQWAQASIPFSKNV